SSPVVRPGPARSRGFAALLAPSRPLVHDPRTPQAAINDIKDAAMSSTTAAPPIRSSDYLALDSLLSDEERDIRDTVRAFVRNEVVPNVGDWFEAASVPLAEL